MSRSVQLMLATTPLELASLAASIDAGLHGEGVERILLHAHTGQMSEIATLLPDAPGAAPLLERFDRIIDLSAEIDPLHPHQFRPSHEQRPMMNRLLRRSWDLVGAEIELILESPQVNPAIALAMIFPEARLRIYGDGLMSYGPTRGELPLSMLQRIDSLDLVPLVDGLRSRLLHEAKPQHREIPLGALHDVLAEVDAATPATPELTPAAGTALILGQYLAALGLVSPAEEDELHREMVLSAAAAGASRVIFTPHPASPPSSPDAVQGCGHALGLQVIVLDRPFAAEVLMLRLRPDLLVSCFSTALATGAALLGTPALAVGTGTMLERLEPYANSNRVPLALADRLWSADARPSPGLDVQAVLDTVAYAMQPMRLEDLEASVRTSLALSSPEFAARYLRADRLTALQLAGGRPRRLPSRVELGRGMSAVSRWASRRLRERASP